jgi:hypothetical protein
MLTAMTSNACNKTSQVAVVRPEGTARASNVAGSEIGDLSFPFNIESYAMNCTDSVHMGHAAENSFQQAPVLVACTALSMQWSRPLLKL